jgi:molybdopterin synthase catalytic subunit
MRLSIEIRETAFDPEAQARAFRQEAVGEAGAVASFLGLVRGAEGEELELTHYPGMTHTVIAGFAHEAQARFGVAAIAIIHRVGRMGPGEPIVQVLAASAHRRDALAAVDFLMDFLKSQAPFWKREHKEGAARWIEPTAQDHDDLARWKRAQDGASNP